MPKKHRAIAGVGPSSIFELKAELYKSQEDSKRSKDQQQFPTTDHHLDYHRAKKKITSRDPLSLKNSGVDARSLKYDALLLAFFSTLDKLELKAVNDGSASYAALERKAELYEKLAKGELSDEDDKEKYCVDFFSKSLSKDESQQPQGCNPFSTESLVEDEGGENDASVSADTNPLGLGRTAATLDNNEHKRFVREVHEEASEAREKVYELKLRRQEQAAARREKLKQAYLRKQLEKLKAASKTQQT
ncbi:hypothetical protein RHSIM_Rhsim02G0156800 [Rhododendron simsii]|uniref:Uncharacterized protein n=1 Tax=Rhododendron simsii TaxID=118357 RepID=A0A834HBG4_RHOSS|nr:hypothetical protein RHSIM_Rhsim02G0156800 [Rhododendron simsii]